MHIVCPHCTTSYAINPATLGTAGRNVRCSRCKETWLARPEDAVEMAPPCPQWRRPAHPPAAELTPRPSGKRWRARRRRRTPPWSTAPRFRPAGRPRAKVRESDDSDWPSAARQDRDRRGYADHAPSAAGPAVPAAVPAPHPLHADPRACPAACAAMGALILALMIWRADVVRLLPQTATFYKMVGLDVNLRGLAFKDIKITNETVDGKPVLVIEGMIVGESRKPVELPRLRFSRPRRAGRRDLRLERGARAAGAQARRARLFQVAAGVAAARRPQYRRTLFQQAGSGRPRLNRPRCPPVREK